MKGGKTASGYTIVEVMIFLAVTGVLFFIAMLSINGQQGKTEFAQGTRDFQASVDAIISNIRNGSYPSISKIGCSANPGSPSTPPALNNLTGPGQGSNDQCIFAGKVMQFDNSNSIHVYTAAARRLNSSGNEVASFAEATPTTVPSLGLQEDFPIGGGLVVRKVESIKGGVPRVTLGAIGFFHSFTSTTGNTLSNDDNIIVVPLRTSVFGGGPSPQTIVQDLAANGDTDQNPDAIVICLEHGVGGTKAALILGENGSISSTQLHIGDVTTAVSAVSGGLLSC